MSQSKRVIKLVDEDGMTVFDKNPLRFEFDFCSNSIIILPFGRAYAFSPSARWNLTWGMLNKGSVLVTKTIALTLSNIAGWTEPVKRDCWRCLERKRESNPCDHYQSFLWVVSQVCLFFHSIALNAVLLVFWIGLTDCEREFGMFIDDLTSGSLQQHQPLQHELDAVDRGI